MTIQSTIVPPAAVAVIGLGNMGVPMGLRLVKAGFEVTGFDVSAAARKNFIAAGGRTADELLSNGHLALGRAKATRRGAHVVFESSIREGLESRLALEAGLALAIERDEFELFYQPQVRLLVHADLQVQFHDPHSPVRLPLHLLITLVGQPV